MAWARADRSWNLWTRRWRKIRGTGGDHSSCTGTTPTMTRSLGIASSDRSQSSRSSGVKEGVNGGTSKPRVMGAVEAVEAVEAGEAEEAA